MCMNAIVYGVDPNGLIVDAHGYYLLDHKG